MLGLLVTTDERWAREAMRDWAAVLRDHAHCEMKAASHALSLAMRHTDDLTIVQRLTAIAREEIAHFEQVLELLAARGIALGAPPVDEYAAELRAAIARLPRTVPPLVDRLLGCALIEARSCERFKLLLAVMGEGHELHVFYTELFAAEARHYREFCDLAALASSPAIAESRLAVITSLEAEIVRAQSAVGTRPTIHG